MTGVVEDQAPACPVHPYGYHSRSRVRQRGSEVLAEPSLVGLPARCLALEHELEESDRIDAFVRQLWVAERQGRTGSALLLVAGAVAGALFVALALAQDGTTVGAAIGGLGALAAASVLGEALLTRTHRTRLRRVYEWRAYVGFQI